MNSGWVRVAGLPQPDQ